MSRPAPYCIRVGQNGTSYKSIGSLDWSDIPPFAVLTGLNGSGKTQLLELLAYRLTNTSNANFPLMEQVDVHLDGFSVTAGSVAYLPSRWDLSGAPALSLAQMQEAKRQLWGQIRHESNIRHQLPLMAKRSRIDKLLGVPVDSLTQEQFVAKLPDDFVFMIDDVDVTAGLVHVFLSYRVRVMQQLEKGRTATEARASLGPAPWDVLNETFAAADFRYRVISPLETGLLEDFHLQLDEPTTGNRIRPMDLSSGELALMGLVLWLYNSQHHGHFPELMLLDEPDAHLHPSMTRHFLSVLHDVLVEKYGVRVILSTHSPSTVALAPAGSIFEMRRETPRILSAPSKAHAIGLLTSGLVTVTESSRFVLVEDEDDVSFYDSVRDILTDYGPTRDPKAIEPVPSLVFLPASRGSGATRTSGGKSVVEQWVKKFDSAPLNELIRGVIDRDAANASTDRVRVLGRYSIENYWMDPIVVFAVLSDQGSAPALTKATISQGNEHLLRALSSSQLQEIVDAVCSRVEPHLPNFQQPERAAQSVEFTTGQLVSYPAWVVNRRGHDLWASFQAAFGGPGIVSLPRLQRSFRRVRLMPLELPLLLRALQA